MRSNEWLTNQEFLDGVDFSNKYYFQSLCIYIDNYRKNIPIPIISTWDKQFKQIYFTVGKEKVHIMIDTEIAYDDYITLVDRQLRQYFPRYEVELKEQIPLDDNEVLKKVKEEKMTLDDAILLRKEIVKKEVGIIEKVFFIQDTFIINIDGKKFLRMSGKLENPLPISVFLKILKNIKDNEEKRNFIFNNSRHVDEVIEKTKEINYLGFQMKKFFEINFQDLQDYSFIKMEPRKWRWRNYIIKMETTILENDVLDFLKEKEVNIVELDK